MASVLSDDEGEERSHPLAQERPGVYVQVVAPRRRKARKTEPDAVPAAPAEVQRESRPSHNAELVAQDAPALGDILGSAIDAHPLPRRTDPVPVPAPESERPSGEREIIAEAPAGYVRAVSQNSNGRSDAVVVTLPPPPRLPSFASQGFSQMEREFARTPIESEPGPSVLDAPTSMRAAPEAVRRTPWGAISFVVALSAIVASAVVVALRGSEVDSDALPTDAEIGGVAAPVVDTPRLQLQPAAPASAAMAPASNPSAAPTEAPGSPPPGSRKLPQMGAGGVVAPGASAAPATVARPAASATSAAPKMAAAPATAMPQAASMPKLAVAPAVLPTASAAPKTSPAAPVPSASPTPAPQAPAAAPPPSAESELPDNPYAD